MTVVHYVSTGFLYGVEALKSVILTVAAAERKLTAEKAVALSRLELQYQVSGPVYASPDLFSRIKLIELKNFTSELE